MAAASKAKGKFAIPVNFGVLSGRGKAPPPRQVSQEKIAIFEDYEASGLAWFWSTDAAGRITYVSPHVENTLGRASGELLGEPLEALFDFNSEAAERSDEQSARSLKFQFTAKSPFTEREVRANCEAREIWWAIGGRPQFDAQGEFLGYRGNGNEVTEMRREREDAARFAQFDSLTGLANRRRMTQCLQSILKAFTASKRACALMMLDLDRFKHVNDTLGHPAGDELLKQVAQRLTRVLGSEVEVGRLGGDEFQVILPDVDDRGILGERADRIIQMLSQPYTIEGTSCAIGASVGIAIAPYDGIDVDELVRSADLALYAAKEAGRGQFRFYSSELHARAEERRQVEEELRDALHRGELSVNYQPLVCPVDNRVMGFEALLRWEHPERGPISPSLFISIAEETGLILQLGEWALRQACADATRWPEEFRVAVNVSPVQFLNDNLPTVVTNALSASGLAPGRLELEITESVFLGDSAATKKMFATLKNLGVRFALDDFGTGYSSLGYLRDAPFDKIKIDQSFIRGAVNHGGRGNAAIISAIVSLAKSLDMDTTAEGIEAMDELQFVREKGVTTVQGYIYGEAMPQERLVAMMETGQRAIEPSGPERSRSDRRSILRKVGLIHEDHRYEVMLRNLSQTGARVHGLLDVPVGTQFVVDFGEGQLVVGEVRRTSDNWQGLAFETPLISDGGGGWCTRHRISPYALASAGMPLAALPTGAYPLVGNKLPGVGQVASLPKFAQVDFAM